MKIIHVISDTNVGGAGILLSNLQSALSDLFDFRIILPRGSALLSRLDCKGGRVTELDFEGEKSFSPRDVRKFRAIFKEEKPDVIHTHAALSARIGASLAGVKNLLSTRHCASDGGKAPGKIKRRLYDIYTTLTVSTAAAATKNLIAEGVSPEKIVTIQNGSEYRSPLSPDEKQSLRASLGIPERATVIGCCARIERVKGQDTILRAAPALIAAHPDVFFLFVGDGSERRRLENLARALGVWGRVKFTGYTERARDLQNLFYINVNASRGTETSCLVTSECMSLGIPTVASDFGGNPEMISHGKSGLIFSRDNHCALAEELSHLIKNSALHSALSRGAAEEYRRRFSLSRMAEEYERLYRSLQKC